MAGKGVIGGKIVIEGEKEYRAALKNITADQKELKSEMKLCTEEFKNNQNSSEALQKKYEVLTKQVDSAKDKVKLYADMYESAGKAQEQSAKKTDDLKDALAAAEKAMTDMSNTTDVSKEALEKQQKEIDGLKNKLVSSQKEYDNTSQKMQSYKTSLNLAEADLQKLNSELIQNEKYLNEAKSSANGTANSIDNMGNKIKETKKETTTFGEVLKANLTGAVIIGGIQALANAVENVSGKIIELSTSAAKYADDILTMSTVTGISTDKLQAYNYMAELTDTSMETIEKTMVKNIKSMASAQKGSEDYVNAYKTLNVAFEDGNKNLLDAETVYWNLIDALGEIDDETKRDSISLTIFGKSAQELNTLVAQGSKGIAGFTDEASKMGAVLDKETLDKLGKTDDAIQRFTQSTEIFKRKIGANLSDELTDSLEKITDAISDSDEKLTELAEGGIELLTDGFTWFIDNSDIIIAGLAGIGSAMIAKKAVDTTVMAVEAYQTLSTAIKATTVSQEALNLVQAASPIGLIIAAAAGVTAALVTYSLTAEKATSDTQKMIDKASESAAEFQKSIDSHNGAAKSIEAEAAHMRILSDELEKLNGKEKLSTNEKAKLTSIVNELNEAMPELNLAIDEQTGKLEGNTKELEANIDKSLEWYSVKAAQEELTAIYEDMSEAELELYKIDQQIAEQNEVANAILKEKTGLAEEYNKQVADGVVVMDDYETRLNQLETKEADVNNVVKELTESKNQFNEVQKQGQEQIDILNGYIDENKSAMEANAEATAKAAENVITYKDAQVELKNPTEETIATIEALQQAYVDAKTAAQESISSQVGLFQELSGESDLSISEMKENLITQTETFTQYAEDLKSASAIMKADTTGNFAEIVSSLSDMGIDGAGYLHELVTAAEEGSEKFGEVMAAFSESKTAADTLAESMADIQTNYSGQMDELLGIHSSYNDEMLTQSTESAEEINEQIAKALEGMVTTTEDGIGSMATAVTQNSSKVVTAAEMLCTNVVSGTNKALGVGEDGKSEVFKKIGHNIPDSIATGVLSGQQLVTSAVQKVVNDAVASIDMSGLAAKVNRALGDAFS